uniref:Elongation of very long chain fatty acids protein n=1 Tax=Aceria tosichella TaxID=561515 RepID=A0A6G1SJG0_9ACAR
MLPMDMNSSDSGGSGPKELDFWDGITDERVNEFYLLRGGPSIILTLVGAYLYFVLSLGPKLMSKHEPFKLNKILLFYNLAMAGANLWLFIQGLLVSNYGLDTLGCGKFGGDIRKSPRRGIFLGYLFFLTKLIELLDTVFFVLRKKKEQVTFLHVFHHSIVPIFCWIGIKLAPGGPNGFFPLVNSFIHVIMYSYYALTTFGPRVQAYLWWKKYLTRLQMLQFILVMVNALKTFLSQDCKFPLLFSYLQASVACAFLILFYMFYQDAYRRKQKQINALKKNNDKLKDDMERMKRLNDNFNNNNTTSDSGSVSAKQTDISEFDDQFDERLNGIKSRTTRANGKPNGMHHHQQQQSATNGETVRRISSSSNGTKPIVNVKLL